MEKIIKKIFESLYAGKNLTLIGVTSETGRRRSASNRRRDMYSRQPVKYTAALKQNKLLIPVSVNSDDTIETIKETFQRQLKLYEVEL